MIRESQMLAMIVVIVVATFIAAIPFLIYRGNLKGVLKTYFVGGLVYMVGDGMIRGPLLGRISLDNPVTKIIVYVVLSVILAIAFRVFILKGVLDKERQIDPIKTGLVLGMGQGAFEALMLALNSVSNFQIAQRINNGTIYDLVSETITRERIDQAIQLLQNVSESDMVLSLVIQLSYVVIYAGIGLMIVLALRNMDKRYFVVIVSYLIALYVSEAILVTYQMSFIFRTLIIVIFALIMAYFIYSEIKKEKNHARI